MGLKLGHHSDQFQNFRYYLIRGNSFRISIITENKPVPEAVVYNCPDIVRRYKIFPFHPGMGTAGAVDSDGATWAGPVIESVVQIFTVFCRISGRRNDVHDVFFHVF